MAKELLETRLQGIDRETWQDVKRALCEPHINPTEEKMRKRMPYLKDDLAPAIAGRIIAAGFASTLYGAINKNPLKRVWYGIMSTGELPENFLKRLSEWERVYFFAGRWKIRSPDLKEPPVVLTVRHLNEGLNKVYNDHYTRKAKGEYESNLVLPEGNDIREAYKRIIDAYYKQFQQPAQTPIQARPRQRDLFFHAPRPD